MSESPLRQMASHRELKAGHFIFEFDTPGIGYILKHAGCDFTILDTEHSGFGIETVRRVMAFMRAAELPTIVRSPSRDYKDIARVLDAGADAVMLPMVSNADEAKSIIHSMKYFPSGGRGVILRSAVDRYTAGPTMEKLAAQNRRTMLVVQIENAEGVENAQAIGALEEVDCLWVGHFDLSCSLGIPGEFDNPRFIEAIDAVVEAGHATGTSLGRLVPDVESGIALIHPLILLSNDTKDSLEYPLLHKHLQKPLHQWTDSLIRPVGNMVIQHQPLTKQRVRTIFHRVRL